MAAGMTERGRDRGLTNASLPVEIGLWSTAVYRNTMATCSTIKVETATKARLMELKVHPRETFNDVIERVQRDLIVQALERTHGNKNRAAQLLGLNRTTLLEKMKKMNLGHGSEE